MTSPVVTPYRPALQLAQVAGVEWYWPSGHGIIAVADGDGDGDPDSWTPPIPAANSTTIVMEDELLVSFMSCPKPKLNSLYHRTCALLFTFDEKYSRATAPELRANRTASPRLAALSHSSPSQFNDTPFGSLLMNAFNDTFGYVPASWHAQLHAPSE